jgi:hypothetical protein
MDIDCDNPIVTIPRELEQPALTQERREKCLFVYAAVRSDGLKRNPVLVESADAPVFENQSGGWLAAPSVHLPQRSEWHWEALGIRRQRPQRMRNARLPPQSSESLDILNSIGQRQQRKLPVAGHDDGRRAGVECR